jgi:hypothetical protein
MLLDEQLVVMVSLLSTYVTTCIIGILDVMISCCMKFWLMSQPIHYFPMSTLINSLMGTHVHRSSTTCNHIRFITSTSIFRKEFQAPISYRF